MNEPYKVINGDCLDVLPSVEDNSIDIVLCDPPYMLNVRSDLYGKLNPWADLVNASLWYKSWIGHCKRVLKNDGCLWTFLNWRSLPCFQKAAFDSDWDIKSLMIWDKDCIGTGVKGLRPTYEMVALLIMPGFSIKNRSIRDIQTFKWGNFKPTGHPAEKPVELLNFLIEISGKTDGAIVLDPFAGSCSTGVSAISTGNRFIGIECDPVWVEKGIARLCSAVQSSISVTVF
jgi:site-specific DNA-methyltransferase (adenine-specific)